MKIFYSFIISCISILGYSQTILYQSESTSRTVQDPQTVVLAQGFHVSSSVANPFVAKIGPNTENPGGGPADSNAGANNPSGTTVSGDQKFHDTKGNIEVTGAGQLQFTLPIALPPGVKSVAPKISLAYTSGSGNGIAGYGWSMSGLTAISRSGKTVEKEGESGGVQLDYSDYYSFNGQRLILKSGEYGRDGAEYVTEKYSNAKIRSVGNTLNISGPDYWEVTFEDGSQAKYEKTFTNSSNGAMIPTLEYNITKWKDAQGNYISYNYEYTLISGFRGTDGGVSRISSINWGGNETLNKLHFNTIDFSYRDRDFAEQSYVRGLRYTQNKLLSEIKVSSNGNQFKRYAIEYIKNGNDYQLVNTIIEHNTEDSPANPVTFNYPAPTLQSLEFSPNNMDSFDNVRLAGDFNGDSYVDFIMNNGNVKLGAFNEVFTDVPTNKIFGTDAKVVNTLLDEEGQVYNGNGIVQYENGKVVGYILRDNIFVKIFEKEIYDISTCGIDTNHSCTIKATFDEGDIDGDGISNLIISLARTDCYLEIIHNPEEGLPPGGATCYDSPRVNFIVDLKNPNIPVSTFTVDSNINESIYDKLQYNDIDGDGKVDIINVSNTDYTVFEFVRTSPFEYIKKIKFTGSLLEAKNPDFPVLYGDFNGDGNLDFTIPVTDTQEKDNWRFYMGTEKGFSNFLKSNFLKFRKPNASTGSFHIYRNFYSTSDINKDGKSDILHINSYNDIGQQDSNGDSSYRTFGYDIYTYTYDGAQGNGSLDFAVSNKLGGHKYVVQNYKEFSLFTPITSQIKVNNNYYDVFLFWKERIHKLKAPSSIRELSQVKSITQGGIITAVDYLEVIPNNTINPNFYRKIKKEFYPYFSLSRLDQSYAVSQLRQEGKTQDFRYRGMTGHMQGKGMIGYYQSSRSSWYADVSANIKIWSGAEIDPLMDGVPVKEWSIRTNDESKIFPTDISENNTQLLSFKSTLYQADKLLNNQLVTAPVSDNNKPNIVTAIIAKNTKSKDFLTGTITTGSIIYGDYYLPAQSVTNIDNNYAIKTSAFVYIHNSGGTGADYYIGRPKSKIDVIQAYGDTKSKKEEYTYENNLLKTLKTWNRDNTGYLLETYNYDSFGNIVKNGTSNSTDSQTQTSEVLYDSKGRFVEKKIDNLGLETNIIYTQWGQIEKQTDPLGNTLYNKYDGWGKLLSSKSNLAGTTTYQYKKDVNSNVTITQNDPDGNISKKEINKLGQEYKVSTKAFGQGQFVSNETQYDILGRKIADSEPYFEGQSANKWSTVTYDDSVFPSILKAKSFNGKEATTSVSGLTTTVKEENGNLRITTKTVDALGNTISSSDKGGTITFSYNAGGEQIRAKYAENIVTTQYDSWGRKSEFNDPSNGTYKYEYDGFGQPKKTISPKGTKEYTYNSSGQLISQKELSSTDGGQATNKIISYQYDDKGRIVSKSGTSKGKTYSANISYDPQGRILSSSESSNGKYFIQKGVTYDDMARMVSYERNLYSSGVLTKVVVENIYSAWNGELYQVKDKTSGKILWELNQINEKGQILKAKLGSVDIINDYNADSGFLKEIKHSTAGNSSFLHIKYQFDAIKNELKSRITGGDFNISESFDYDDNNRLVKWTNPVTGHDNTNVYDVKGRILENNQVGTIKFDNAAKIYQPTGMTLNAEGSQNYNNDLIQSIAYNENNDPVFIDGAKGDVAFQYGLTNMRQKVSYGGNFDPDQEGNFTKYYSEDGSFEILKDNITGKEKHILYIGGSPYESNIVYIKDYSESTGSYKFLHKDYLGSILAISDQAGNKLEQRHFDAWGNFTHLQIGNGPVITDKNIINNTSLLLDRGYTSHEHFAEVGIIHMNGRLYDPLLRRFLNADEYIQDPYNTQNYNKYGYVLNNPLIYNDPSGEVLPFLIGVGLGYFWAAVISGAIIGAAISVGMYALQATLNNNWSWGGFAKSILIGTVTGAVSAGLGDVFNAGGFWATAGNGALAGAGSSGVVSLINGDNFLEGLAKGAVIGGAVASISYSVNYLAKGLYKAKHLSKDQVTNIDEYKYDVNVSKETMQENIDNMRSSNFSDAEMKIYRVESDKLGKMIDLSGYLSPGPGRQDLAYTTYDFLTGRSTIYYSPIAAQNNPLLALSMVHETGHGYGNALGLIDSSIDRKKYNINYGALDTTQHFAIAKLEHVYAKYNLLNYSSRSPKLFVDYEDVNLIEYFKLSPSLKSLVDDSFQKLLPVFQRFMHYKR